MAVLNNVLFLLCFLLIDVYCLWEEIAGPYDLIIARIGECDKKGPHNLLSNMKMGKYNRTHLVYNGMMDLGADMDDTIKVRILASNKGTNGRYNNVIDVQYKVCDLIESFAMDIILSAFNHCNRTYECPSKRWTCEMKNWVVDYNLRNIPALPYGEYKSDFIVYNILPSKKQELLSCLRAYGRVTPKFDVPQTKNQSAKRNKG